MIEEFVEIFSQVARHLGIRFRVTSIRRSRREQRTLYQRRGKSPLPAAAPGTSTHEYGLAFDVVASNPEEQELLGAIGEALGLYWGGRFRRPDPPHFQIVDPARWWPIFRR